MKVLIVEDNSFDSAQIKRVVARNPSFPVNDIDTAYCIDEAKEKLAKLDNDFVILDLKLPATRGGLQEEHGGQEILKYIKNKIALDRRPEIIVMSVFPENSIQAQKIEEENLTELISAWFNKMNDFQEFSQFLSEKTFKQEAKIGTVKNKNKE